MSSPNPPIGTTNNELDGLYFDQDGADAAYAAVQIAKLTGQKTLVASDIVVV